MAKLKNNKKNISLAQRGDKNKKRFEKRLKFDHSDLVIDLHDSKIHVVSHILLLPILYVE